MRAEWDEIIELAIRASARGVRVALPARVVRVENAAGRVAVRLELRRPRTDPELEPDEDPPIADVPVMFPSSGAVEVSYQIDVGDQGLVLFADFALARWLSSGELVDPGPGEAHGLSGAVFLPGLWPDGKQVEIPSTGLIAGERGGEHVEVASGRVLVGTGATERAIKGDSYLSAESAFVAGEQTWLAAFVAWIDAGGFLNAPATVTFKAATVAYQAVASTFQGSINTHKTTVVRVK